MNKILIADDDSNIRELVGLLLSKEGFEVIEAPDGLEALSLLENTKVDMAIIDIMMPQMDGWELCLELKRSYDFPILMLTAKGDISQKIKGFQLGTDDYLVKPFEPMELIMRVKALMRRYNITSSNTLQLGKLYMNSSTFEAEYDDEKLNLPLKEFELLFKLACCPGKTIPRDNLIEDIWGYDFEGNERTLDVHINRLRERFPEKSHDFKITTVRGLGYRLEVQP